MNSISSNEEEKRGQLQRLEDFHARHVVESGPMLERLKRSVLESANVFDVLMDVVRCCSLRRITNALFDVSGQYPRSMQDPRPQRRLPEDRAFGYTSSCRSEVTEARLRASEPYEGGPKRCPPGD